MQVKLSPKPANSQPGLKPVVSRPETWFPVLITGLVFVLTGLPYLYGYLRAPQGKTFMGIMLDVPDTTQYWAWMREMRQSWFISNPLTSEPNDPVYFNLLWGLLGHFQALSTLEQAWVYQGFRGVALILFGWLAWTFCKFIFARPLAYRTAFLLIMLGSGWGWLPVTIKQFTGTLDNPLSVFVAEPNAFYSALAFPHLLFSAALVLGIFQLSLLAGETGQLRFAGGGAVLALILGLEHTYDLLIVYAVLGAYWLWRVVRFRRAEWVWVRLGLIIGLVSALPSLYSVYLTTVNPTWKGVLDQYGNGLVFTPDPINLLILIGPLLLLAFLGLLAGPPPTRQRLSPDQGKAVKERLEFIKVWFLVGGLLIYIPTNFQVKMLNGWQVPVFMLAVAALLGPVRSILGSFSWQKERLAWARWFEPGMCTLLIVIALPTTLYLFSWRLVDLNRVTAPYYLQNDELAAMTWLEKPPDGPGVVLASEELGQYLAPRSGQRPFLAHWAMTLKYYQKRALTAEVLNPATSPGRRQTILREYQVKYILYGSAEKKAAPEFLDPNLRKVFTSSQADIYEKQP